MTTTVDCIPDENNNLVIKSCRVWDNNQGDVCTNLSSAGTGSKCDCDPLIVTDIPVPVAAVPLTIVKSVDSMTLPEPGGEFNFTAVITNPSTVSTATIISVNDTYGTPDCNNVTSLGPNESVICTFTATHTGNAFDQWTNNVIVVATDESGNQVGGVSNNVTVNLTDVAAVPLLIVKSTTTPSLMEPGGTFMFSVDITNPSTVDTATITTLSDTYGNLSGCVVLPYNLLPGLMITCNFTAEHLGNAGDSFDNNVTVTATDDDG
ncbi:MAG: hypothetical protein KAI26_02075, partial [Nanoarchaeota archaeon]|nr:hypothetical protein [Nanoarchaeota archaeon]